MYEVYSKNEEGIIQTSYASIDKNFEQIWNIDNVVFTSGKNDEFDEKSAIIGNNGDVFVLGERDKTKGRKIISSNYELIRLNEDGIETLNLRDDDLATFKIKDVILTQSTGNTVILSGYYYADSKGSSAVKGVYIITLDSDNLEVINNTKNDFSFEFISKTWSKKKIEKTKKKGEEKESGITSLYIKEVINHDDGSTSLIGEKFWTTTRTTMGSDGSTSTSTTYHWENLIITRISKEGEIISHSRYVKHSTRDDAFDIFVVGKNIFVVMLTKKIFFYHEDLKGMTKAERAKYAGWYFTASKIAPDGESEKYILLDYTKPEYSKFRRYDHIGKNSIVIQNKKSVDLLVVTYKGSKKFALARFSFTKE